MFFGFAVESVFYSFAGASASPIHKDVLGVAGCRGKKLALVGFTVGNVDQEGGPDI